MLHPINRILRTSSYTTVSFQSLHDLLHASSDNYSKEVAILFIIVIIVVLLQIFVRIKILY